MDVWNSPANYSLDSKLFYGSLHTFILFSAMTNG